VILTVILCVGGFSSGSSDFEAKAVEKRAEEAVERKLEMGEITVPSRSRLFTKAHHPSQRHMFARESEHPARQEAQRAKVLSQTARLSAPQRIVKMKAPKYLRGSDQDQTATAEQSRRMAVDMFKTRTSHGATRQHQTRRENVSLAEFSKNPYSSRP